MFDGVCDLSVARYDGSAVLPGREGEPCAARVRSRAARSRALGRRWGFLPSRDDMMGTYGLEASVPTVGQSKGCAEAEVQDLRVLL